jgi:hypothetical protein
MLYGTLYFRAMEGQSGCMIQGKRISSRSIKQETGADGDVCSTASTDDNQQRPSSPEWITEDEGSSLSDGSPTWLNSKGKPAFVSLRSTDVELGLC